MSRDPKVDAYIARKPEFARPILERLRAAVHAACPEVEEALKWSSPAFLYKGEILAQMAAFNTHAGFGFWRGADVTGDASQGKEGMGSFGKLTGLADLPDDKALAGMIRKAMALVDAGDRKPRPLKHAPAPAELPEDFAAALSADAAARASFDSFPPGARRDYIQWVTDAKRPETRASRIAQAVAWLAEGKKRNWKYEKC